jgi:hypothetical protein
MKSDYGEVGVQIPDLGGRAALVVSHPGHELRVYEWLRQTQPRVFVLTDGSGHMSASRLAATTRVLREAGAQQGSVYGRFTDRQLYAALLAHDFAPFITTAEELAAAFTAEQIAYVVADAAEGYNPAHDVCRLLVDTAVRLACERWQWEVTAFDFFLVGRPPCSPHGEQGRERWIQLDGAAFERKRAAAYAYTPLAGEIEALIANIGEAAFRSECLRLVDTWFPAHVDWATAPPYYEQYGEGRVAAGLYQQVIRYREHIKPLADMLQQLGAEFGGKAACEF